MEIPKRFGSYQRAILSGNQRLSGADLSGKAKKWSLSYRRSRASVVAWALDNGYHIRRHRQTNFLELVEGEPPEGVKESGCSVGPCYGY